jgi:hypothetical protein
MEKMNRFLIATFASVAYFVIVITLKYSPHNNILDLKSALIGAVVFWIFIFLIHHLIIKRPES